MTDTINIPDEAVQAPVRIRVAQDAEGFWTCREAISGSQEYIRADIVTAHLSAPCAVEVIKLNWDGLVGFVGSFSYVVAPPSFTKGWRVWGKLSDKYASVGGVLITTTAANEEEAKAAAQADFERRILSCIVTKPVDVAAVLEQCAIIAEGFRDKHWIAHDIKTGIFPNRSEAGIAIAAAIRDLSPAEPVDQWQDIAGVGERERLIIIGSYNAKGLWCAEVWHTKYLRDQQAKSASDFFMNAPHLEWVPTHFMELPAAPTSKGGSEMSLVISNLSHGHHDNLNHYEVCINDERLALFDHTPSDGISVCLRLAADALEKEALKGQQHDK